MRPVERKPSARKGDHFPSRTGAFGLPGRILDRLKLSSDRRNRNLMPASTRQLVKPPALRPGDTVGIVAPASNLKQADLDAGCEALQRAGYKPFYFDSILERDLVFRRIGSSGALANWKRCSRATMCAPSCARAVDTARTTCSRLDLEI